MISIVYVSSRQTFLGLFWFVTNHKELINTEGAQKLLLRNFHSIQPLPLCCESLVHAYCQQNLLQSDIRTRPICFAFKS